MKLILTFLLAIVHIISFAQQNTTVVQQIDMNLVNIIRIRFTANNSQTGNLVQLNINNINDMISGVTSSQQYLAVASTKTFNVNVKSSSSTFSYTGGTQQNTTMDVQDVLKMKVTQNNTGGSVGNGFGSYHALSDSEQNIINGGDNGVNKIFRIRYKAKPGLDYAGGNYLASVVFTATQQ